jgi:hypothetical protein
VKEVDDSLRLSLNPEVSTERFRFYSGLRAQKSLIYDSGISVFADQAYFNWNMTDKMYFSAGKRRLPSGYSYFWSPSFIVNPGKYAFDPELYSVGLPMLLLGHTGEIISPKIMWIIEYPRAGEEIRMEDSYIMLQADFYLSGFEFFINGLTSKNREQTAGAGIRKDIMGFTLHAEGSAVKNNQRKYYMYDPAVFAAGGQIYTTKKDEWYPVLAAGLNSMVFTDGFIILEYYYDKAGLTGGEFSDLLRSIGYFGSRIASGDTSAYCSASFADLVASYAPGSIRQNYVFFSYAHTVGQKWGMGLRGIMSLDDGSGFVYPFISFEPFADFQAGIEACFPLYANADSEFGTLPFDNTAMLKIKVFF